MQRAHRGDAIDAFIARRRAIVAAAAAVDAGSYAATGVAATGSLLL